MELRERWADYSQGEGDMGWTSMTKFMASSALFAAFFVVFCRNFLRKFLRIFSAKFPQGQTVQDSAHEVLLFLGLYARMHVSMSVCVCGGGGGGVRVCANAT